MAPSARSLVRSLMLVFFSALLVASCASIQNTLAQDLASERWEKCRDPRIGLKEIRPDGQIWLLYSPDHRSAFVEVSACLQRAAVEQGTRKVPASAVIATVPAPRGTATPEGYVVPIWTPGDEWAYRNEQPSGASTFVWAVARTEVINGVPHYVIKSGSRELFHRTSDLAITHQRVSGDLTNIYRPSWPLITFPLTVGKTWEAKYTEERPVDRQTEEVALSCVAETEEMVTVPAGTFNTIRVYCKNARTGTLVRRVWFSPQVKHMIKEEATVSGGIRSRELIAFKIR